jgi:hypothetical protein
MCSLVMQNLGPTHGVMMLYSAAAAILGPSLLLKLRSMSELKYINELLQIVSVQLNNSIQCHFMCYLFLS